jgi:hypothetical protein
MGGGDDSSRTAQSVGVTITSGNFGSNIFPERASINWTAIAVAGAAMIVGLAVMLHRGR